MTGPDGTDMPPSRIPPPKPPIEGETGKLHGSGLAKPIVRYFPAVRTSCFRQQPNRAPSRGKQVSLTARRDRLPARLGGISNRVPQCCSIRRGIPQHQLTGQHRRPRSFRHITSSHDRQFQNPNVPVRHHPCSFCRSRMTGEPRLVHLTKGTRHCPVGFFEISTSSSFSTMSSTPRHRRCLIESWGNGGLCRATGLATAARS